MWITDKFKVVYYNLRSDKRMVRKIVFGMTIVFVLAICFTTVIYSYEKYKDNFNKKHKKDCYYYSEIEEQLIDDGQMSKLFDKSEKIRATYSAGSAVTICGLVSRDKKEVMLAGSTRIEVENKRHSAKYMSAMAVSAAVGENVVNDISPIEIAYFQKGMKISPVPGRIDIQGNFPDRQGEIMLGSVICLILIFSIIYLFSFYWYRQKKYRTMLLCIGMQKSDQKWIRVLEIMVFILLAFVLGSYFSAVLLMLMNFVSTTALGFPIRLM